MTQITVILKNNIKKTFRTHKILQEGDPAGDASG
jgi:hypothetical protein